MKSAWFLVVFSLAWSAGSLLAAQSANDIDAVLARDRIRTERMMAGSALDELFSDELIFAHSDGRVEGKKEYIANLVAGDTAYAGVKTSDVQARKIAPEVVVLVGAQEMRKKLGPAWSEVKLRFMSVWRNEDGSWRMVAWQSARPAGNSVVPPK